MRLRCLTFAGAALCGIACGFAGEPDPQLHLAEGSLRLVAPGGRVAWERPAEGTPTDAFVSGDCVYWQRGDAWSRIGVFGGKTESVAPEEAGKLQKKSGAKRLPDPRPGVVAVQVPAWRWSLPFYTVTAEDEAKFRELARTAGLARPAKPRRVLIVARALGYAHNEALSWGNRAFCVAGEETGAFAADVTNDVAVLANRSVLGGYDAVVLNNCTFVTAKANPGLADALCGYVRDGGGLCLVHSSVDSFYDAPEVQAMNGGRFCGHPWMAEGTWSFRNERPDSPLMAPFRGLGPTFRRSEEIYVQASPPFDRKACEVLISMDLDDPATKKSENSWGKEKKPLRTDGDYAVSWTKRYGAGRIFYTSFGHDKRAFFDPARFVHMLLGLQHCLGDPLRVEPVLTIPKPGAVRPSGWLLRQAQAQRDGATARMDEVDVQFRRAWAAATCPRGKDLKWHADPGAWSCEGGAYWLDGLVKLAWQLDDPALKAMASNRLETVLSKMPRRPIGFCWWLDRDDPACVREVKEDNWLLWVAGMFERPVSAWYEATGDRRVPEVLRRVFDGHVFDYGNLATTPSAAVDAWRLTGDARIAAANDRQFARLAGDWGFLRPCERQYYAPPPKYLEETLNLRRRHQGILGIPTRHGVIASETLLSVFRTYQWTGDERLLKAVRAWYAFFDTYMRQPCGVTTMDEEWGYPGPGRGTETCVVAAEGWTRINLLAGLGEGTWGDDVERNFFNAGLACATVDYRRHVYMQQPNRTVSNELSQCSFSGDPGEFLGRYDPKHWPLCCTAALNRILPNFIQAMWMMTADGGVAATLYGPCSFETDLPSGRFSAVEDTRYPFEETIRLRIRAAPAAALPLSLRLPAWCAAPEIAVNGTRTDVAPDGKGFARIVRQWTPGDIVTLRFPQRTERRSMRDLNLGQFGRRYDYFTRGPLLLASPVPAEDANTPIVPAEVPAIDEKTTAEELGLVPYGTVKLRVSLFPVEAHTEQPMRLDPIFADGLVLAAGKPVRVFGTGDGVVRVTFLGRTAEARSADGRWLVELPPAEKGGPHELTVELNGRKTVLRNVRVGEVYLLAGQSNLQFKLKASSTPKADYRDEPDLRMFSLLRLQRGERFHPADGWVGCRRENAGDWSAIGYHFGMERRAASGGAVGVVNCYQGASVIQSWMPEALANDPAFALEPGDLHADFTIPAYMSWNSPGTLYRQMFRRVVPFSFTGVVWYQGESNTGAGEHRVYADELAAMITAWRKDLRDADLPFCVVQIADFDRRRDPAWKRLQDAQGRIGEKVGGVTVVRSADVCESNDIHPASKAALAQRISVACGTRRDEYQK